MCVGVVATARIKVDRSSEVAMRISIVSQVSMPNVLVREGEGEETCSLRPKFCAAEGKLTMYGGGLTIVTKRAMI